MLAIDGVYRECGLKPCLKGNPKTMTKKGSLMLL